jgi:hypothetical protein
MKTVHDLNKEELEELQECYFYQLLVEDEEILGDIDEPSKLPMDKVIAHYEGVYFVEKDFFCNL